MKLIKIFGIGSPFGDDQAGWHTVNILRQKKALAQYIPHFVHFEQLDRPGIGLLQRMRDAKAVILIDAVKSGANLGTLHQFENLAIKNIECTLSSHGIGVIQTLQLGVVLNELPELTILYGIEIGETGCGTSISLPVKTAANKLAGLIIQRVQGLIEFFGARE